MRTRMAAILVAVAVAGGAAGGDHGKIQWGTSYSKAIAEAKESGKPIVIYFFGEG